MSNKAAVLNSPGARLVIEDRPIYSPGPDELLVKVHAVSIAPVDYKMQDDGVFISSYPTILGSDIAGTITAVGSHITHFRPGDRITGMADGLNSKDPRNGAFQQHVIVKPSAAARIPPSLPFDSASIIPMGLSTAAVGIFLNLAIPRPTPNPTTPPKSPGAFLVWGAASSVGSSAVQLARALNFTIHAVASPKHHPYLHSLGAAHCYDYRSPTIISDISTTVKSANMPLTAYDAISDASTAPKAAAILDAVGGGKLCLTLGYPETAVPLPDSVQASVTYAMRVAGDQTEFGGWLFNEWLERALEEGTFVPSPKVQKVGRGIEAVQEAVDAHKRGVSGVKLVVEL